MATLCAADGGEAAAPRALAGAEVARDPTPSRGAPT